MNNTINTESKVLALIEQVKKLEIEKGFDPIEVYTKGDCGNLFFILKDKFQNAVPYIRGKHIITFIDGSFYDIRGEYLKTDNIVKATLADLKRFSYNYNIKRILRCENNSQKLKYLIRNPEPEKVPLKTRLAILRDDFKQGLTLKDFPEYFRSIKNCCQASTHYK